MKTRDIVLIAAAGALVYYATRRRTPARGYIIDVPPPTPITREEYERATRQAPRGRVVDIVKNLSDFLSKLGKKQTQPKYEELVPGEPWYGQRRIGKFNDFTT